MQLGAACERFAVAAQRLGDHAQLIGLLEAELAALEGQAGWHRSGPSPSQRAADLAMGELAPLQPHLPAVSEEATEQARTALMAGL